MKRIVILLHEHDRRAARRNYIAWGLRERWRERGIDVVLARGVAAVPDADLLLPHLDLTVVPDEYQRLLDGHPAALNRRARDISKSVISANLVRPGDGWTGPVIVKTDRNSRGEPERLLAKGTLAGRVRRALGFRHAAPRDYRIFPSVGDVPASLLADPALVVERFLPEMDGDLFCLRVYTFCGSRHVCTRRRSPHPVVKATLAQRREDVEVPAALVAMRERLGFDYGKFDFVLRDGEPVLFDANRTPTYAGGSLTPEQRRRAAWLADGIP